MVPGCSRERKRLKPAGPSHDTCGAEFWLRAQRLQGRALGLQEQVGPVPAETVPGQAGDPQAQTNQRAEPRRQEKGQGDVKCFQNPGNEGLNALFVGRWGTQSAGSVASVETCIWVTNGFQDKGGLSPGICLQKGSSSSLTQL